jgi:hypothetical protein
VLSINALLSELNTACYQVLLGQLHCGGAKNLQLQIADAGSFHVFGSIFKSKFAAA